MLDLSAARRPGLIIEVEMLCGCLRDATGLRELSLSGCVPADGQNEERKDLLATIFGLARLEALDASEGALALFDDSGVEPPAQPLARLKRLDFSGNDLNAFHSTGGPVLALMAAAPNLEELSLCRCSLQAVQVQMICLTATQGRLRAFRSRATGGSGRSTSRCRCASRSGSSSSTCAPPSRTRRRTHEVFLDCLRQCASLRRLDARDSGWISAESLRQILAENSELTVTLNGLRRD